MMLAARRASCPKRMVYGPCGGVRPGGRCEVDDRACPFVDDPAPRWSGAAPDPARSALTDLMASRPVVVTDLRVVPFDPASVAEITARLGPTADALLIGEHQGRPDLPPATLAQLVRRAGGRPWVTLTCRDRNAVVLAAELAALRVVGADGVHCVTGDARGPSAADDATQVFDLDAIRLTAKAAEAQLAASVAATPLAEPVARRPERLLDKQRAGASFAFVNHCGGPDEVRRFADACRTIGVDLPLVPCVAVFTDAPSAAVLDAFPGSRLDRRLVAEVLAADDPVEAGIRAAVEQAEAMLAVPGVAGVDLSGAATAGPAFRSAEIMAEVGARLLARVR